MISRSVACAMLLGMVSIDAGAQQDQGWAHDPMLIIGADEERIRIQPGQVIDIRRGEMYIRVGDSAITLQGPINDEFIPSREELEQVEISSALADIVDRLGDEAFDIREAASAELQELDFEHVELYAALERLELTLEQRTRMLNVLRQRLFHAPRGAVGIRMRPEVAGRAEAGVVVIGLIPGLPAEQVLLEDDRITHIDGRRIESSTELTSNVQARRPGDRIRLTVERPERDEVGRIRVDEHGDAIYKTLEVDLSLGSADRLVDPDSGMQPAIQHMPHRRYQEIRAAYARFVHDERKIELQGEFPEISDARSELDELVEDHVFLRQLREQRHQIDQGNLRATRMLREQWETRRRVLEQQLGQPNLTEDERRYLLKVLSRYEELMRP